MGRRIVPVVLVLTAAGLLAGPPGAAGSPVGGAGGVSVSDDDDDASASVKRKKPGLRIRKIFHRRSGLYRITGFRLTAKRVHLRKERLLRRRHRRLTDNDDRPQRRRQYPVPAPGNPPQADTARAAAAAGPLELFRSPTPLTDPAYTSNSRLLDIKSEPTVANLGRVQLVTANFTTAMSIDNGISYLPTSLNPVSAVAGAAGLGFTGDQVTHTAERENAKDILGWVLMTLPGKKTQNAIVLHVFVGEDALSNGANATSCRFDFVPSQFGLGKNRLFDRPRLGVSDGSMYLSVRYGKISLGGKKQLIVKMDLDDLADCRGSSSPSSRFQVFEDHQRVDYVPVENAAGTMFLAARVDTFITGDSLRVLKWPDSATSPTKTDVNVTNWPSLDGSCQINVPVGPNPCDEIRSLIETGFRVDNSVGWLWTASQNVGAFPYPHVRVAVLDTSTLNEVGPANAELYSHNYAIAYPSVAVNDAGHIALTVQEMGGTVSPRTRAYIIDHPRSGWPPTGGTILDASTATPTVGTWGDYYSVARYHKCPSTWIATTQVVDSPNTMNLGTRWFGEEGGGCKDLQMKSISAFLRGTQNAMAFPGDQVDVTARFLNTGSGLDSYNADIAWFLSTDSDADDADDVRLSPTLRVDSGIRGSTRETNPIYVTLPANTAGGPHNIVGCIDWDDRVEEISELDNCAPQSFYVNFR